MACNCGPTRICRLHNVPKSELIAETSNLRAINSDLLAALYQAKETMEISEVSFAMRGQCGMEPLAIVRAAIAKAEGK